MIQLILKTEGEWFICTALYRGKSFESRSRKGYDKATSYVLQGLAAWLEGQ